MNTKRIAKLRIAAAAICLAVPVALSGPAFAADYSATSSFSWITSGTTYALEEGHFVFAGDFSGLALPETGDGPLAQIITYVCPGIFDIGGPAQGFCVGTDADGDKVFAVWSSVAAEAMPGTIAGGDGEITYTGGTGKFEGITGGGTFFSNTVSILPNGSIAGFTPLNITYTIPD